MKPRVLLAKRESVEGTDSVPTAANAIDTIDLEVKRYDGPKISRNLDRQTSGNQEEVNTSPRATVSCKVEAAGSGTAGTAPAYADLLLAAGLNETVDSGAGTVTYTVDDDAQDSVTLYEYDGETKAHQKIPGVRGNLKFSVSSGQLPQFSFEQLIGDYNRPVAGVPPTGIDWTRFIPAVAFTSANVPSFQFAGHDVAVESMELDWGNEVPRIDVPNLKTSEISDRLPSGSITIYAPEIDDFDFWGLLESHNGTSLHGFVFEIGTVAGNILNISANEAQFGDISEGESNKRRTYTIPFKLIDKPVLLFK